jgi:DNA-binding protein YbaB
MTTINQAVEKGKERAAAEMKKLTGGLDLPPGLGF